MVRKGPGSDKLLGSTRTTNGSISNFEHELYPNTNLSIVLEPRNCITTSEATYPECQNRIMRSGLLCEFAWAGCNLRHHPDDFDKWIEHSISHVSGHSLPVKTVCSFCDIDFDSSHDPNDEEINWGHRMAHINHHDYQFQHADATAFKVLECYSSTGVPQNLKIHGLSQHQWKSDEVHESRRKFLFQGRGDWLVESEKFRKWCNTGYSSIFWLSGKPGSGKSYLTSVVIDKLKSRSRFGDIVAFFCGDWKSRSSSVVADLLETILLQLQRRPTNSKSKMLLKTLEADLVYSRGSISTSKMTYLLSTMRHNLKNHETLFLVIDGLEEAAQSQQHSDHLLRQFLELIAAQDTKHRIKCFFSSRPEYFPKQQFLGSLHMDVNNESAAQQEIAAYVWNEIIRAPTLKRLHHGYLLDTLVERLISKADGVFLWASLQLSQIFAKASSLPFSLNVSGNMLDISKSSGLTATYDQMLKATPTNNRDRLYRMLGWVAHSARPLSLKELGCAVHYGVDLTESIIWTCSGGLLVTGNRGTVKLVHWSVAEYLSSNSSSPMDGNPTFDDSHEMIARECLLALPSSYLLRTLSLPLRLHDQEPPLEPEAPNNLLQYALRYWKFHYKIAEARSKVLPGILHGCLNTAIKEEDLASRERDQDIEISTMASSVSLNTKVANIALLSASRFGFPSLAKLELQMGADSHINPQRDVYGNTALHLAVMEDCLDVVKILVQYGAHPLVDFKSGHTPLACAVYRGHYEIVEFFLSAGADANSSSSLSSFSSTAHNIESSKNNDHGWICYASGRTAESASTGYCSVYDCEHHHCDCCISGDYRLSSTAEIEVEAVVSELCFDCGEIEIQYCMSSANDMTDMALCEPVVFGGETISKSDFGLFEAFDTKDAGNRSFRTPIPQRQRVKWLPGVNINTALTSAAKRGIDDVRRLLRLAGNDERTISRITSLTQLMSKLTIG